MGYDSLELKQVLDGLSELFDAVLHGEKVNENSKKSDELEEELKRRLDDLRELITNVVGLIDEYVESSADPECRGFAESVGRFVSAAAQQEEGRLKQKFNDEKRLIEAMTNSEAEMARIGIESFLMHNPLKINEGHVLLSMVEDSYLVKGKYKCAGGIEYEYILDSKASSILSRPLTPASLGLKIRLPIRIGKSWMKQSTSPQMVKIDKYMLKEADATHKSLFYVLTNPDDADEVRVVYTKNERASLVAVGFKDLSGLVDVSGDPTLSKHLNAEAFKDLSEMILNTLLQLTNHKLKLTKLTVDDANVLEKHMYYEFLLRVLNLLPVKTDTIYSLALQAGLKYEAKNLLEKIHGFGEKTPSLLQLFNIYASRSEAN